MLKHKGTKARTKTGVIIVAAGGSTRMGGIDKVKAIIAGKSVLEHCISTFAEMKTISEIVIVTREDLINYAADLAARLGKDKVRAVIKGGKSRTESAYLGQR